MDIFFGLAVPARITYKIHAKYRAAKAERNRLNPKMKLTAGEAELDYLGFPPAAAEGTATADLVTHLAMVACS